MCQDKRNVTLDANALFAYLILCPKEIERKEGTGRVTEADPALPDRVRVTFDSSVLISYIGSKNGETLADKAINKAKNDDVPVITNILLEECVAVAERKRIRRGQITAKREKVHVKLSSISNIVWIPMISDHDLEKRYGNRDKTDLKILYSADASGCAVLIAYDKDLLDGEIKGLTIEVLHPLEYLKRSKNTPICLSEEEQ